MKHFLLLTSFCSLFVAARTQDPVKINARSLKVCDTIQFEWDGTAIGKGYKLASLHLWIDDIQGGTRWKYRYPIINGKASGSLELPASMKPGAYAFNFMGSETYLEMRGQVKKVRVKTARNHQTGNMDTVYVQESPGWVGQDIKYNLVSREGILFDSVLQVHPDGAFRLPPIVFGDTASLNFRPAKTTNSYYIYLETPLDSAFTPFHTQTVFVEVKQPEQPAAIASDSLTYTFTLNDPYRNVMMLDEVIVTGRSKTLKYEKQYVSPQFRNILDGKTFSAWEDDIEQSNNIFSFIQGNVPGIQIRSDAVTLSAIWRGKSVSFFLDEVPVDITALRTLPASEVAVIKTYPAPATLTTLVPGGAVAIYTKRGEFSPTKGPRYSFVVNGYTQGETAMK